MSGLQTFERTTDYELRNIVGVLRRQIRIIGYTFLIVFGLAALFLIFVTPTFTASSLIFVNTENANILDSGKSSPSTAASENARVDSEVEILRSDAVALEVIANKDLVVDKEFGPEPGLGQKFARAVGIAPAAASVAETRVPQTLSKFRDAVSIRRKGLTYLIDVSVSSRSPERAAELANALAETYVAQQVQTKIATSLAAKDLLQQHLDEARQTVASFENDFDVFIDSNLAQLQPDLGNPALAALRQELDAGRIELQKKLNLQGDVEFFLDTKDWAAVAQALSDQALIKLEQDRMNLVQQLDTDGAGLTMAETQAALSAINDQLKQKSLDGLADLRAEIRRADKDQARLRGEMRTELLSSEMSPEMLTEIYALQQESAIARGQYQTLLTRMRALETQAHLQIADSRIVSPALVPAAPSFPNQALVLLAALALSSGLGVSLAFLNEYYIGGITTVQQLAELVQLPVAASVPFSDEQNAGRLSVSENVLDSPLSVYSESIRKLRAAIDQDFRSKAAHGAAPQLIGGKVLLVTSPLAGEGKTTIALSLARTYALAGQKTLLIDADLRKPSLHRHLGLEPQVGFLDYLRDPDQTEDAGAFYARDTATDLALIMGAGRSEFATDQLLNTTTFETLLNQARNVFDVVVVDSPPLLPVVDARYLANHADAIILAVKWAATSQSDLRAAAQALNDAKPDGATLFPVLSQSEIRVRKSSSGNYYSRYSAAI